MRIPTHLLSLPSSLLIFISTYAQTSSSESQWPYNLPPHVKYFPEDEVHVKRSLSIQSQLATQTALVIRKMSPDEGEMFFLDYWQFDLQSSPRLEGPIPIPRRKPTSIVDSTDSAFSNSSDHLFPPFLPHAQSSLHYKQFLRFFRRTIVQRDFQCPTGTNNCSSIQRPNNCCATDETCVIVADTGDGDVGCCPSGSACGGSVSSCDTGAGYTSCPNSPNGGCCIPGFTCQDIGCVASNTATTTTTLPTATVTTGESSKTTTTSSSTPTPTSSSGTTAGAPIPAPSTSASPTSSTTTTTESSLTCTTGFQSCPASVGGGCCPTDRACGSPDCPPLPSSTSSGTDTGATAVPPVRPTSDTTSSPPTTSTSSSVSYVGCPTGFYACSAYYPGGCCRVGRDCSSTSCPSFDSTTPVTGTVATVAAAGTGSCASGWLSCAADEGGGCCPSGYSCGASCTATGPGGNQEVGKVAPNAASAAIMGWSFLIGGYAVGLGMLIL